VAAESAPPAAASPPRLRVVLISHLSSLGGACRSLQTFAEQLLGAHVQHEVVLPSEGPLEGALTARRIPYRVIQKDPAKTAANPCGHAFRLASTQTPLQLAYRLRFIVQLARWLRRTRPDVVWVNSLANASGVVAARLAGVPCVWHIREGEHIGFPGRAHRLRRPFLRLADRVVTVSDFNRRFLRAQGVPEDRLTVVYNGVDLGQFSDAGSLRRQTRASLDVPATAALVGTVHMVMPGKGTQEFVRAAGRLAATLSDSVEFLVVGDAQGNPEHQPYFAAARDMARRLGIADRVRFVGHQQDVRAFLAAMDVFVLPSFAESLPVSILEAMAMGKPVVASSVGGVPELVVEGETGELVPPGDVDALAASIGRLATDPARARRLGAAGRARVARCFDARETARQLLGVFEDLVAEHSLRGR
jgi:glycosyltransferase involved in cell wall biosynthesis